MFFLLPFAMIGARTLAALTPTSPGPGDTYRAGSPCTIEWNADSSGTWANFSIYFMTGSNDNMTRLATVTSVLDGTDPSLSPYNWTCPEVEPYSAVYFYQFTNGEDVLNFQWTTRFTITSDSGDSVRPEYDSQPNGDPVPWGQGHISPGYNDQPLKHEHSKLASSNGSRQPNEDDDEVYSGMPTDDPSLNGQGHNVEGASSSTQHSTQQSPGSPGLVYLVTKPLSSSSSATSLTSNRAISRNFSIPTMSLPRPAGPPIQGMTSSASAAINQTSAYSMGPGISDVDNSIKLSGAGCGQRGVQWKLTTTLCSLLVAVFV